MAGLQLRNGECFDRGIKLRVDELLVENDDDCEAERVNERGEEPGFPALHEREAAVFLFLIPDDHEQSDPEDKSGDHPRVLTDVMPQGVVTHDVLKGNPYDRDEEQDDGNANGGGCFHGWFVKKIFLKRNKKITFACCHFNSGNEQVDSIVIKPNNFFL